MMTSDLPPYVYAVKDSHGKIRYRFRRKGWPSAYLPGLPGSAEFHRAYAEIIDAGPLQRGEIGSTVAVIPKSLDDLARRMKQGTKWAKKGPRTQLVQGRIIEKFLDRVDKKGRRYGARPVAAAGLRMTPTPSTPDRPDSTGVL